MESKNSLSVPIAIVLAGVLIAGAVLFTQSKANPQVNNGDGGAQAGEDKIQNLKPITQADHRLGNPDSTLTIVEYSDAECPFCQNFHRTMEQVISEYGASGKVSWIYRHFPLDVIPAHKWAPKEAEAAECVFELAGNDVFWNYLRVLVDTTRQDATGQLLSEDALLKALSSEAVAQGVAKDAFESCLRSGRYTEQIKQTFQDAVNTGCTGTPCSFIVDKDGNKYPIEGAQPFQSVKQIIDTLLNK